ncbi:DUF3592 domain-containing protein [uncultured Hyphomicrobium sp.]|uniref:DUF3592 domain-containing protein n=1 Tax=uncultured Hyphomicrobium sp. TaxID=194373 RepID=UPI0025F47FB7|nr:DUF3592 domain-containing protein [uncultured Hyphomicrobium sp.]
MNDLKLSLFVLTAPFVILAALAQLGADFVRFRHITAYGLPATAVVERIEPSSWLERPEGGVLLTYTLDLPGPAFIHGAAHLSDAAAARYEPGEDIEIVYAANNPKHHALSVAQAWSVLVNAVIVFTAYGAVLALALALLRVSPYKSWRDEPGAMP